MCRKSIFPCLLVSVACCAADLNIDSLSLRFANAEAALRSADISTARAGFESILRHNPNSARAHFGLARLHRMAFRRNSALRHFAAALLASPNDPTLLREYASATPDPHLEASLLTRLVMQTDTPQLWKRDASARLTFLQNLADTQVNYLRSPYKTYQLKMPVAFNSERFPLGWIIRARINDGRVLRLMLDTGSRGILISRFDAAKLNLKPLAPAYLDGFGEDRPARGQYLLADRVALQDLEFSGVVVEAADLNLRDVDGLIGLDLFRQFLITLDGPKKSLILQPMPDVNPQEGSGERPWSAASLEDSDGSLLHAGHLLVARGASSNGEPALFVLDSGASYSLLQSTEPVLSLRTVTFEGLSGKTSAAQCSLRT